MRRWSATRAEFEGDSALFQLLNASKRGIVGVPGDDEIEELVATADVVVESFPAGSGIGRAWAQRHSHLVVLSVTPYGQDGPLAQHPSTEYTAQAQCGAIACRGRPDQPPIHAGGGIAEWTAGAYAGPPVLSALLRARRTGRGEHIHAVPRDGNRRTSQRPGPSIGGGRIRLVAPVARRLHQPLEAGGVNTNKRSAYHGFVCRIERAALLTRVSQIGRGGVGR